MEWNFVGFDWQYGENNVTALPNKTIKVLYPKGSRNPKNKPVGGFGAIFEFLPTKDPKKLTFSYQVEIPKDFDFVKGGKLPGIYFKDTISGGEQSTEGGTVRFMWRAKGQVEIYVYHPKKKGKFGDSVLFKNKLKVGESNTFILSWEKRDQVDLIIATVNDETLTMPYQFFHDPTGIFYSTFFGGHDRSWRTRKDESLIFKNFHLELDEKALNCFPYR